MAAPFKCDTRPHYALKDLAKLDGRAEAHLDGLRVAGEPGWELSQAGLGNEENGEVFAASVMAFESGIESRIQAVLEAVKKTPELSTGSISALGWIAYEQVSPKTWTLCCKSGGDGGQADVGRSRTSMDENTCRKS